MGFIITFNKSMSSAFSNPFVVHKYFKNVLDPGSNIGLPSDVPFNGLHSNRFWFSSISSGG